jgi:pimeloyl-ACP methyl ester carboxylesterase
MNYNNNFGNYSDDNQTSAKQSLTTLKKELIKPTKDYDSDLGTKKEVPDTGSLAFKKKFNIPFKSMILKSLFGIVLLWLLLSSCLFFAKDFLSYRSSESKVSKALFPEQIIPLRELPKTKKTYSMVETGSRPSFGDTEKVILYFHGNGGRNYNMVVNLYNEGKGYHIFSPAYPGYHENDGNLDQVSLEETALESYKFLVEEKKIKEENIIILGHSLGGYPATYLASQKPKANKLVLINAFSSGQSLCFDSFSIFCVFGYGHLNTASYASNVTIPVNQFAFSKDLVIKFGEQKKLFDYFGKAKTKDFYEMNKTSHDIPDYDLIVSKSLPFNNQSATGSQVQSPNGEVKVQTVDKPN